MKNIIIDSGPLIALFDRSDRYHQAARQFIRDYNRAGALVTNLPVITEVIYMLDFSGAVQIDFLSWAEYSLHIDTSTKDDLPRIRALFEKYSDLPADFADASLVALCERLHISYVASVDSDFTIYRSEAGQSFLNLFFYE